MTRFISDVTFYNKVNLYNYIKLPIETPDSSIADAEGCLRFTKSTKTAGLRGTLSVSNKTVEESGQLIKWQNLIHTVDSQDKSIVVTSKYPGEIDLSYAGDMTNSNYLDSSSIVCIAATIDSSAALDDDGICYISGFPLQVNPIYRYVKVDIYNSAYQSVNPEKGISFLKNGRYIKIHFGTRYKYTQLCFENTSNMYVRILVGKAYNASVSSEAPADSSNFDSSLIAKQTDASMWAEFKNNGGGYIDISVGVPETAKDTSTTSHSD